MALTLLALVPAGAAAEPRLGPLAPLSVPNPFPDGCGGERTWAGADFEPHAAVNPRDPRNIAVAWIEGSAVTVVVASSHDGGRSWRQTKVPGLHCTGDAEALATGDPWLAFGPDGVLHLTAGSVVGARDPTGGARRAKVVASRSLDGGRSWTSATVVEDGSDFNDKPAITTDPERASHAWIVWTKGRPAPDYLAGDVRIAETNDHGRSWSASRVIIETLPEPHIYPWGAELHVLPDGTLVAATMVWQPLGITEVPLPERGQFRAVAVRSVDGGATWSAPVKIADVPAGATTDPEDGKRVRANQGLSLEVGPDGTAYALWWEEGPGGRPRVVLAESHDGGATWSSARVVGSATHAFLPALTVADDGTIAVTYFDLREDVPGDGQLTTVLWLAHSRDGGDDWEETRLTRSFDYRTAQEIRGGLFLGDYFGLVAVPDGFGAVPALSAPIAREGPSDIFFRRIYFDSAGAPAPRPGEPGGSDGGGGGGGGASDDERPRRDSGDELTLSPQVGGSVVRSEEGGRLPLTGLIVGWLGAAGAAALLTGLALVRLAGRAHEPRLERSQDVQLPVGRGTAAAIIRIREGRGGRSGRRRRG